MKLSSSCPAVESTNWSIQGSGKLSFGKAWLRLEKSMYTFHLPLCFFTSTGLDIHFEMVASLMKPLLINLSTSSFRASYLSAFRALLFYLCGSTWIKLQTVTTDLWVYSDYVLVFPCKDIWVLTEEVFQIDLPFLSQIFPACRTFEASWGSTGKL